MNSCRECEAHWGRGYPFCLDCGAVSPALTGEGPFALKIGEVPSQQMRDQLVSRLQEWFPGLNVVEAEKRLRSGETRLLRGMDASSGRRILDALRDLKVAGVLEEDSSAKPRLSHLWNFGLVASFLGLGAAAIVGGWTALLLVVAALIAPLAGAIFKARGSRDSLVDRLTYPDADYWLGLAAEYTPLLQRLPGQDRDSLKEVFRGAFDLQTRVQSGSLPSVAAGFDQGELHERLKESLRSALEMGRHILRDETAGSDLARAELRRLAEALRVTRDRFISLETGGVKSPQAIASDLEEIMNNIDRIVKEARPLDGIRGATFDKQSN